MKSSKLIKMLKGFTKSEFSEFEKFVNSPFFSKGRDLSEFFRCIKPFYPDFDDEKFTPENFYKQLHPKKKIEQKSSEQLLQKLSSELYKHCKEYLIQLGLSEDESRKQFYLLNKLREKKLFPEFGKEYDNTELKTDDKYKGGVNDFMNRYYIRQSFLEYCIDKGDVNNAFESIITLGEYSVITALVKGFRNIDAMTASKNFNVKTRYNLADNFISHLDADNLLSDMKKNNDEYYPYAAVSYGIHKLYKYPDSIENFTCLKKLIFEHLSLFGHTERYILLYTLVGYCNIRITKKDFAFLREQFEIFKTILELGVYKYSDNDKLQINTFRQIVLCAVDNNELIWLENFVRDYTKELHPEYRENMKHFSLAYIFFMKKDFENSLEQILRVKYDVFFFKLDVKNLMFKIFYELGSFEQAFSILNALRNYIANTKDLNDEFKNNGSEFIKYATELLKHKTGMRNVDLIQLKNTITKENLSSNRDWILEKCDELLNLK